MSHKKTTLKEQFEADDRDRSEYMERVKRLAVYTDRSVLPDDSTKGINDPLKESYQSLGALGTNLIVGRLITTTTVLIPTCHCWPTWRSIAPLPGLKCGKALSPIFYRPHC